MHRVLRALCAERPDGAPRRLQHALARAVLVSVSMNDGMRELLNKSAALKYTFFLLIYGRRDLCRNRSVHLLL